MRPRIICPVGASLSSMRVLTGYVAARLAAAALLPLVLALLLLDCAIMLLYYFSRGTLLFHLPGSKMGPAAAVGLTTIGVTGGERSQLQQ